MKIGANEDSLFQDTKITKVCKMLDAFKATIEISTLSAICIF